MQTLLHYKDWKIGTKIFVGYILMLILIGLVGAAAILRLNQINQSVHNLSANLTE